MSDPPEFIDLGDFDNLPQSVREAIAGSHVLGGLTDWSLVPVKRRDPARLAADIRRADELARPSSNVIDRRVIANRAQVLAILRGEG